MALCHLFWKRLFIDHMLADSRGNITLIVIQQVENSLKGFMRLINVCIAPKTKSVVLGVGAFCYLLIHNASYMQDIPPCFVNSNMQGIPNFSQPYRLRSRMIRILISCPMTSRPCFNRSLSSAGLHAKAQN